jgi:hypothetical protein
MLLIQEEEEKEKGQVEPWINLGDYGAVVVAAFIYWGACLTNRNAELVAVWA